MMVMYSTKKSLLETNCGIEQDEFKRKFYRNLAADNQKFELNQFDDMLNILYKKNEEDYKKWYKALNKIPLFFVKRNMSLTIELLNSDNIEALNTAFEMEKRKRAVISNNIIYKATYTSVNKSKKEILIALNNTLLLMKSDGEDNILKKAKEDFAKYFGKYENDICLGKFYKELLDSIEEEMLKKINDEIKKVDEIEKNINITSNIELLLDTRISNNINRCTVISQRRSYNK